MRYSNDKNTKPIGVFDSGVGGLSVAREISRVVPNEDIVYVGDNGFFPYGEKTAQQLRDRVFKICEWLVEYGCKAIVIACNTATIGGLDVVQTAFGNQIPIIGVIEPGAIAAVGATVNNKIGILATKFVVDSKIYSRTINRISKQKDVPYEVTEVAAPDLVELVENKIAVNKNEDATLNNNINQENESIQIVQKYCTPLTEAGCDTVVMGCTHFPLAKDYLQKCLGEQVRLVSPSYETSKKLLDTLTKLELLNTTETKQQHNARYKFFITGFNETTEQKFDNIYRVLYDNVKQDIRSLDI